MSPKALLDSTSIGPDHGTEQENHGLNVVDQIVGITHYEKPLDK